MNQTLLEQRLAALQPTRLEIRNDSAQHAGHVGNQGGGHYSIVIESSLFSGKSPIMRHRLVYQAVGDLIPDVVHALSIKALAPGEAP
ncbi:MAG: BolA family transcriptional regulator [Methylophilaceae bacterium]|nr:BolA family transcriptional regulator [Methylophilaceae bacterium]